MNQHHARRTSLPQGFGTSLIGRAAECDTIERLLLVERVRVISITGPGGVGKTRLALHAAAAASPGFQDGVATVFLSSVSDHRLVPLAIARALDLKLTGDAPAEQEIVRALRHRELLLVIDTFEHLLSAARLLPDLLDACPGLSVVITSRVTPGIPGEAVFRVAPLAVPPECTPKLDVEAARRYDAVALFEDRARAAHSEFILTDENAETIARICRRLDGLPLAIELAAARTRALPPNLILRRIEEHHDAAGSAARDAHARHRTLRDAIAWSYDLLTSPDRRVFRALSAFRGPFTLADATALLAGLPTLPGDHSAVERQVDKLAGASLLAPIAFASEPASYVMLGLLREYGQDRLREHDEIAEVCLAHARWVATQVDAAPPPASTRVDRLREEIRAAIDWALARTDQALAGTLLAAIAPFWIERGYYQELRAWLENAISCSAQPVSTEMLLAFAQLTARQGELLCSLEYAGMAFDLALETGDRSILTDAALAIATAEGRLGDHQRSQAMAEQALAALSELDDPSRTALARTQLAHLAILRGDLAAAQALAESALKFQQAIGDRKRAVEVLDLLSLVARLRGDSVRQSELAWQTLELTLLVDDPFVIASGLWTAAAIACERGCYCDSARFYGAEEAVRQTSGFALDPGFGDDRAASVTAVRAALGSHEFSHQWGAGRSLAGQAIREAAAFLGRIATCERETYEAEKRALQSLGLSERQQDVLRLIGQGRSDREIAEMLSISARTVSKHVEAILVRMDARTRSGAAALAARLIADSRAHGPDRMVANVPPGHTL
jgi:non-specific serine/threonine protein kinase